MVMPGHLNDPADIRRTVDDSEPLEVLETEMAVLQRALERLARRSDIHRDLDRASYLLARTVDATGPVSVKALASRLGLDATTVTRQVSTMERRGLVGRHSDPKDGRVSVIELSPRGRRTMRAVQRARRDRARDLFAKWSPRDQREFGQLLGRFNDAICDLEHTGADDSGSGADASGGRRLT
jgi:DNA-binding MarR family transcriptional regulator